MLITSGAKKKIQEHLWNSIKKSFSQNFGKIDFPLQINAEFYSMPSSISRF